MRLEGININIIHAHLSKPQHVASFAKVGIHHVDNTYAKDVLSFSENAKFLFFLVLLVIGEKQDIFLWCFIIVHWKDPTMSIVRHTRDTIYLSSEHNHRFLT